MKRCDICLKKCEELTQLSEHYKTDDIEECCVDCMNIMNKQLHKVNKMTANLGFYWMKRFLKNLREDCKNEFINRRTS